MHCRKTFTRLTIDTAIAALTIALVAGCTPKGGKSANGQSGSYSSSAAISISLPGSSSSNATASSLTNASSATAAFSASASSSSPVFVPTDLQQFDCFAVNVLAPDIQSNSACGGDAQMGIATGFVGGHGGVLQVQVPFGKNRTFQVWGFANSSSCADVVALLSLARGQRPPGANSPGFLIGQVTTDISSRNVTLDIPVNYTFGKTPMFCGNIPPPSTTVNSNNINLVGPDSFPFVFPAPVWSGVALNAPQKLPAQISGAAPFGNMDACISFSTTATHPSFQFTCTETHMNGATTVVNTVPCGLIPKSTACPGPLVLDVQMSDPITQGNIAGKRATFNVTIKTTDTSYNLTDPSPPQLSWVVNQQSPSLALVSVSPGTQSSLTNTYFTNSGRALANLSVSEASTITVTELSPSPGTTTCATVAGAGTTSCILPPFAGEAAYTFNFTATDSVGNTSTIGTYKVVFDITPPILQIGTNNGALLFASTVTPATISEPWLFGGDLSGASAATSLQVLTDDSPIPAPPEAQVDPSAYMCTRDTADPISCGPAPHPATWDTVQYLDISSRGGHHTISVNTADLAGNATSISTLDVYFDSLLGMEALGRVSDVSTVGDVGSSVVDESASNTLLTPLPSATGLNTPGQSALDSTGDGTWGYVYVADTGNHRVLAYHWNLTNHQIASRKAVAVFGQPDYITVNNSTFAITTSAAGVQYIPMSSPTGVAVGQVYDPQYAGIAGEPVLRRKLFVADTGNNRILRFDVTHGPTTFIPDVIYGQADDTHNAPGAAGVGLNAPQGLALSFMNSNTIPGGIPGVLFPVNIVDRVFVADTNNCRVAYYQVYVAPPPPLNPYTNISIATGAVGDTGNPNCSGAPTAQNSLDHPTSVAIDSFGVNNNPPARLYVADTNNNRIMAWNLAPLGGAFGVNANLLFGRHVAGDFNSTTDATAGLAPQSPNGVAIFRSGVNVFVGATSLGSDHQVKFYNATNTASAVIHTWNKNSIVTPTQNAFHSPMQLGYDPATGTLFVSDTGNHRIGLFTAFAIADDQNMTDELGHTNFLGSTLSFFAGAQNGPNDAKLNGPTYAVADPVFQRIYVSDTAQNRVLVYPLDTGTYEPKSNIALAVIGVPVRPLGNVFLDTGACPSTPDSNTLCNPTQLALDSGGKLYVVDQGNNRVVRFPTNVATLPSALSADLVLGQQDFKSNTAATTGPTGLDTPTGVAYDATNDRLYVSDSGNDRIEIWNSLSTVVSGAAANQTFGSTGTDNTTLSFPTGLSYTEGSANVPRSLFIADTGNNRVVMLYLSGSTGANGLPTLPDATHMYMCFGQQGPTAVDACGGGAPSPNNSPNLTAGGLSAPQGVFLRATTSPEKLFIADTGNSRVVAYDLTKTGNKVLPVGGLAPNATAQNNAAYHAIGANDLVSTLYTGAAMMPAPNAMASPVGIFGLTTFAPAGGVGNNVLYIIDSNWNRVGVYEVP